MTNTGGSVQQVRERVLQLAREIEQLSQSNIPPESFFPQFLQMLVSALGARAGAVWMLEGAGRINLLCDVRLAESGIRENAQVARSNDRLLGDVIATGEACAHAPDERSESIPFLVILAALQVGDDSVGVVEIFQRPDAPVEARPGYLQFVEQMTGYASRYLERRKNAATAEPPEKFHENFEQYLFDLSRSLDTKEVAATAANDGRRLLRCDRMSVAILRGRKTEIKAISGQDHVNARANVVRAMAAIAEKVIAMREPVLFTGKIENLAPQLEKPLADFVHESGSRMVMLVPMFETVPLIDRGDPNDRKEKERNRSRAFGCLIIEQVADSKPQPELESRAGLIADHAGTALFNARRHERVFLLPVWQTLGRVVEWFHGRKLAKTAAIGGAIAVVGLVLALVPWDYRVEGEGRLMPVIQRQVFAPDTGEVAELFVQGGERVEKGMPLLKINNDQLKASLLQARNERESQQQIWRALQGQRSEAAKSENAAADIATVSSKIEDARIKIEGYEKQIELLEKRTEALTIRAPISGVVATFQLEQLLRNRPVQMGELLLEVMDDTGDWRLELEVEEHRMGQVFRAQDAEGTVKLPLEFILATSSESTYKGEVQEVATRAATSAESGAVFEIFATTDRSQLPVVRVGAEVRAKIYCGRRSLGYVLFGDVIEFVRQRLWL
ncbi:MAG: efflux RND transporter periplasmic adaptor subunit [Planctomycetaceae bacterium]